MRCRCGRSRGATQTTGLPASRCGGHQPGATAVVAGAAGAAVAGVAGGGAGAVVAVVAVPPLTGTATPRTRPHPSIPGVTPPGPSPGALPPSSKRRRDVDYFRLDLPYAGVLTASTTGGLDTTGRLYQAQDAGAPLLVAEDRRLGRAFRLGEAVAPGVYYLAVSAGGSIRGDYTLRVHYTPAFVDNPGPDSPQSGVSVLSGWVCEADTVAIEFETTGAEPQTWVPATGTSRPDTAVACGPRTTDTGYGLLFNWNLLGDGEHTVRVLMDDVVLAEREITVTTLGEHPEQEFRRELSHTTEIADFPDKGETTTLRWQEARQNFMIARGDGGGGGQQLMPDAGVAGQPRPRLLSEWRWCALRLGVCGGHRGTGV